MRVDLPSHLARYLGPHFAEILDILGSKVGFHFKPPSGFLSSRWNAKRFGQNPYFAQTASASTADRSSSARSKKRSRQQLHVHTLIGSYEMGCEKDTIQPACSVARQFSPKYGNFLFDQHHFESCFKQSALKPLSKIRDERLLE